MTATSAHIEIVVSTLLQLSERVLEVSEKLEIGQVWDKAGQVAVASKPDQLLIKKSAARIKETFSTRKSTHLQCDTWLNGGKPSGIKILPIHPDKEFVFVVVEEIRNGSEIAADKWRMALDTTGDGMWELNMQTDEIIFSKKWHTAFGYQPGEIKTGSQWSEKLHPEDLEKSKQNIARYLSGETTDYSTEVRFKSKDGTYKWILSRGIIVAKDEHGQPAHAIGTHTDINERKIAEEKFSSLAQLLSKLINNLHDGILVTDENNQIVFANKMFCDIYGISTSPEELAGLNVNKSIWSGESIYANPARFKLRTDAIMNKKTMVLDEEWLLADGRTLNRDFIPLNLGENNKGGIWKLRDITTQKNTEKRLSELRSFYEQILNHIAADIVVFDAQRRYLFINPAAIKNPELRIWMIGKTDEDYCRMRNKPLSMAERRQSIFETARDERRAVEWEERLETSTGDIEYHLRVNYPVFDEQGNHTMSIGYGLNITDRKLAEDALKTSQETFASAFNYSGIGMALIGLDGKWLDVNNMLCIMIGYSKEELMQRSLADITYPGDLDSDSDLLKKLLRRDISKYTIERRYVSKRNKIVLVLLTVSLVWTNTGSPKFLIAQVVDISLKKALEMEINKKTAELEATKVNLINKINQLEELNHIIAHNLRGPAGNIKTLSTALLDKHRGGQASADNMLSEAFSTDEVLELIQESSISLMDSLANLMKITEIKLNKEIPYDDCDVSATIKDITSQLHTMIFEKRAIIVQEIEVEKIKYPKAYLENILYNLISNALKYSHTDTPPEIKISTRMNNGKVQIIVKDNGLGIDMDKFGDKIFKLNEVFHKGHDSKGVGLYITKTQIESFGGTISLQSQLDEGCEFTVTL